MQCEQRLATRQYWITMHFCCLLVVNLLVASNGVSLNLAGLPASSSSSSGQPAASAAAPNSPLRSRYQLQSRPLESDQAGQHQVDQQGQGLDRGQGANWLGTPSSGRHGHSALPLASTERLQQQLLPVKMSPASAADGDEIEPLQSRDANGYHPSSWKMSIPESTRQSDSPVAAHHERASNAPKEDIGTEHVTNHVTDRLKNNNNNNGNDNNRCEKVDDDVISKGHHRNRLTSPRGKRSSVSWLLATTLRKCRANPSHCFRPRTVRISPKVVAEVPVGARGSLDFGAGSIGTNDAGVSWPGRNADDRLPDGGE